MNRTLSETPKTGFLASRYEFFSASVSNAKPEMHLVVCMILLFFLKRNSNESYKNTQITKPEKDMNEMNEFVFISAKKTK